MCNSARHRFRIVVRVPGDWSGAPVGLDTTAAGHGVPQAAAAAVARDSSAAAPPLPVSEPLLLVWDSGSEAMVWSEEGQPLQVSNPTRIPPAYSFVEAFWQNSVVEAGYAQCGRWETAARPTVVCCQNNQETVYMVVGDLGSHFALAVRHFLLGTCAW